MKTTFNSVDINFQSWHVGLNKTQYHRSHHAEIGKPSPDPDLFPPQCQQPAHRHRRGSGSGTGPCHPEPHALPQQRLQQILHRCAPCDPHPAGGGRSPAWCAPASIAPQRIHYKGSRGFELATSGNKVLIVPEKAKHVCKGTCPNCRCKDKKARAKARNTVRAAVASGGAAVA